MTPLRSRRLAAVSLGSLGIAVLTAGLLPPAASAEVCTVTDREAVCGPGGPQDNGLPPDIPPGDVAYVGSTPGADADRVSAAAVPGADDAIAAQRGDTTVYGFGRSADGPTASSAAIDRVDGETAYSIAASGVTPTATADSRIGASRATSRALGPPAAAGSAAAQSSRARADARGREATAAAAALDHSRASAHSSGTGASSGAAAGDHSIAYSRAFGRGSSARAAAVDHDGAYALAFLGGAADASPAGTQCRGGVTFALDQRNPALCTSAGPLSTGLSTASGPAIGLAGVTPTVAADRQGRHRA